MFGETFVKGESYTKLAEGVATCRAMVKLAEQYNVEMPIVKGVNDILSHKITVDDQLAALFLRSIKDEF